MPLHEVREPPPGVGVAGLASEHVPHVLVVAKLDRLSRSSLDFAGLMAQAGRDGWSIDALDVGIDTSTINGELIATLLIALAQPMSAHPRRTSMASAARFQARMSGSHAQGGQGRSRPK